MKSLPVILLGGGGHATVLAAVLRLLGQRIAGCIALEAPSAGGLDDIPYLGPDTALDSLIAGDVEIAVAVGSNVAGPTRARLFQRAVERGLAFVTIIHPSAIVDPSARLGRGVQIMAGAIVQTGAEIGDNVIINTGGIVEHGCRVGPHVHVASGAVVAGDVAIGAGSHVGAGAVILQGCKLGEGVTVGAAACVTRDVARGSTVVGVPARGHSGRRNGT
ncbi:MAG: acetyltransferase [Aestuariivirga sp.]